MAQEDITASLFADILPRTPQQEQLLYQAQRDKTAATIAALEPGRGVVFSGVQAAQDVGRSIGEVGKRARGLLGMESSKEMEDKLSEQIRAGGADILKTEGLDGYLNYLSDAYGQAGMTDKAAKAKLVAEKLTQQQDEIKSTIAKNLAAAKKSLAEKTPAALEQADRIRLAELQDKYGPIEGARRFREERDIAGERKASATAPKQFGADISLRESFLKEVKPIDEPLNALEKAEALLTEQSGLADSIAKRQFAKFAGDRDISNKDVAAFGNFGPLGQRLGGIFSQFLQGTYSDAQRQEAINIIKNLRNPLEQQRASIEQQFKGAAERQGITGDQSSFVVPSRAKGVRQIPSLSEPATATITLPSGNKARPIQ